MEKNITVKEITENWYKRDDKLRDDYLDEVLQVEEYIPYIQKVEMCNKIIDISCHSDNVVKISQSEMYFWFCITMINVYTNIELNFDDICNEYDLLQKTHLSSVILTRINEEEITEFRILLDYAYEDFIQNNVSIDGQLCGILSNIRDISEDIKEILPYILSSIDFDNLKNVLNSLSIPNSEDMLNNN